jgi:hypothetical protein
LIFKAVLVKSVGDPVRLVLLVLLIFALSIF